MSAYLLGVGFKADMKSPFHKLVLLKMIDACEDDGTRIFPAVETVARAAQCSTRTVQRIIDEFRSTGLLRLVREGGKGRRSTNEYALDLDALFAIARDGWEAWAAARGENGEAQDVVVKGDTVSPLNGDDEDAARVTPATPRVTPETPKGDTRSHPTPPDSSITPQERERASADGQEETEPEATAQDVGAYSASRGAAAPAGPREGSDGRSALPAAPDHPLDDPKRSEARFYSAFKTWPRFDVSPKRPMLAAWAGLTGEEKALAADAVPRFLAACRAQGVNHPPAISTYLGERMWEAHPAAEGGPAQGGEGDIVMVPAFGPEWAAMRFAALLAGPQVTEFRLTAIEERMVETGAMDRERLLAAKRQQHGWPTVNVIDRAAGEGRARAARANDIPPAGLCEAVPVGSETFEAWRRCHEERGWPWIPSPGRMAVVWFPKGGPAGLDGFCEAVRRSAGDPPASEATLKGGAEKSSDEGKAA